MIGSASSHRSTVREPGANPGRSRRCKGSCSPATTPLAVRRAGKAAGEGAPSQKTCRASHITEPLAEGGFRCFVRPSSSLQQPWPRSGHVRLRGRRRPRGPDGVPRHDHDRLRQGHDPEEAGPDRLALADGDRVALRDRRRPAGRRRRRPVRLPEERPEDDALRLHAERRGDRRLPPGSRRHLVRPEGARQRAQPARDPRDPARDGVQLQRRVPADPPARPRHRARGRSGQRLAG